MKFGQINEVWRGKVTVVLLVFLAGCKRAVTGVTPSGSVWESVGVCSASWLTETGFTVSENTVASQLVL